MIGLALNAVIDGGCIGVEVGAWCHLHSDEQGKRENRQASLHALQGISSHKRRKHTLIAVLEKADPHPVVMKAARRARPAR